MSQYYYVYRLTCTASFPERYYYGYRSSKVPPEQDVYWSSSKYVRAAMKQWGQESFRKKILAVYSTSDEAIAHEIALHAKFDVKNHPAFFNRANQTSKGFSVSRGPLAAAHKESIRKALQGKKVSKETRMKMSQSRKGKPWSEAQKEVFKNRVMSEKTKQKISAKLTGRRVPPEQLAKRGSPSEATKLKISAALRRMPRKKKCVNESAGQKPPQPRVQNCVQNCVQNVQKSRVYGLQALESQEIWQIISTSLINTNAHVKGNSSDMLVLIFHRLRQENTAKNFEKGLVPQKVGFLHSSWS